MLFYFLMRSANLCSINVDPLKIEVLYLKKLLSIEINANQENIILIANGGLCIQDGLLCNYNCADNEENPVFVYLRQLKRSGIEITEDNDLNKEFNNFKERLKIANTKIGNHFSLLQEYETVSALIFESSKKINNKIKLEIRNQFLLVEGWSAALANLYDSLFSVEKRIDAMKTNLDRFFNNDLDSGFEIMTKFGLSKSELESVPLLSVLFNDSENQEQSKHPSNLLQWVLSQDNRTRPQVTVQSFILEANEAYNDLLGISDERKTDLASIKDKWGNAGLIATAFKNMEIGKLLLEQGKPNQTAVEEDIEEFERVTEKETHTSTKDFLKRLDYLSGVREHSEKLVSLMQTHKDYMDHTVQQCKDSGSLTALMDHCANSRSTLENVGKQYSQLKEYLFKVERSKQDLATNIDCRKIWLQKFQTKICEIDESMFLVKEKMKRVRTGLRVLDQMNTAPLMYARGVAEIARRHHYLDFWFDWGCRCSSFSEKVRKNDQNIRRLWEKDFENHFVQSLFSSLYSFTLPKLGIPLLQSVRPSLPKITEADLNQLAQHLSHLGPILKIDKIDENSPNVNSLYSEVPINEDNQSLASIPTKTPTDKDFDGVALFHIPDDNNIDELVLSQRVHLFSEAAAISQNSTSNSSSKMVKSIDSMEFQLTNDATTETKKDIVCVSSSMLESLAQIIKMLKSKLKVIKTDQNQMFVDQNSSYEQIKQLLQNISEKSTSERQIHSVSSSNVSEYVTQSVKTQCTRNSTKIIQITHKEFSQGDPVSFIGFVINGTLQWRMISTDNRIYFLNDSSLSSSPLNRRRQSENEVDSHKVSESETSTCLTMAISDVTTVQPSSISSVHLSMPIVTGIYMSKDEYMCKKAINRYGLPINTKFFRVHANVDWGVTGSRFTNS